MERQDKKPFYTFHDKHFGKATIENYVYTKKSQGNRDKTVNRYIPNHKVPLTEHGHHQAREAGKVLKSILKDDDTVCFYTSPYMRARQTTVDIIDGIKDTGIKYKVYEEPRMREQDFGNFQSTSDEMQQMWVERAKYGHFFYRIPHGESAADVYDRCASFNASLFRQFSQDSFPSVLVLVTHGIWARVFLMKWFRWKVEYFEDLQNVPHCSWIVMQKNENDQRYTLKTHMTTWSELKDPQRIERMREDTSEELKFNSNGRLSDNEMNRVVDATVKVKEEQVRNALETRKLYEQFCECSKNGCSNQEEDGLT
ncbi:hypothetical protein FOA43_000728 [Brettanomyces nanus]|uniref:Phosphoglycerate mutase-like protein n=1 Tax=Eeniella nana TaxID=13502 RepID=A0A875RXP5_EENNA|nr:uncharacterized protein FOA43_000728 [Brettanomyces nanus]QPG73418.1 hypothetical protein FOA43_000728 [Brettanomyces nanus]